MAREIIFGTHGLEGGIVLVLAFPERYPLVGFVVVAFIHIHVCHFDDIGHIVFVYRVEQGFAGLVLPHDELHLRFQDGGFGGFFFNQSGHLQGVVYFVTLQIQVSLLHQQ